MKNILVIVSLLTGSVQANDLQVVRDFHAWMDSENVCQAWSAGQVGEVASAIMFHADLCDNRQWPKHQTTSTYDARILEYLRVIPALCERDGDSVPNFVYDQIAFSDVCYAARVLEVWDRGENFNDQIH